MRPYKAFANMIKLSAKLLLPMRHIYAILAVKETCLCMNYR